MVKVLARLTGFWRRYRFEITAAVIIFLLAGLPRLLDLGTFLTADEKNWIGRGYEFVRAFKDWRFNDMLQTTHPGVTVMWLSGVAASLKMVLGHIPFSFQHLREFIYATQFPVALANTLIVPAAYLLLRRVLPKPRWLAEAAGIFLALDPFLIGYSRVVHVDALLAGLMLLAALSLIRYGQTGYQRKWLILAGVFSSLALLTKAPAVFLVPYLGLVMLVSGKGQWQTKSWWTARVSDFALWLIVIGVLFVLLWPAILWVPDPEGNILVLKRDYVQAAITPHHMAEDYSLNGTHYIFTLLTRTSPIAQVLLVCSFTYAVLRIRKRSRAAISDTNYLRLDASMWLLLAYVFFFIVMMTLGAKKGDRYILPVFPVLDILAAAGFVIIGSWILRWGRELRIRNYGLGKNAILIGAGFLLSLYLGFTVYRYHPYEIAYSNPLFPDNLSQELGWGEGLEQVGAWLSLQSPLPVVASWYPEELRMFTKAQVAHINAHEQAKVRYVVLYRNMFGRAPDHPANDFIDEYYKKRKPVFVAKIVGKEFAWVYEKRAFENVLTELIPGTWFGQSVDLKSAAVSGVDILLATYSGRATAGELTVEWRETVSGTVRHAWQVPIKDIKDDAWLSLKFPPDTRTESAQGFIRIEATGTRPGNAPTVRFTKVYDYRPTTLIESGKEREGELAVRVRYVVNGQEVTDEDTRWVD